VEGVRLLMSIPCLKRAQGALVVLAVHTLAYVSPAAAAPRIKVLKLSVTNPGDDARAAENVVLAVRDLAAVAPDFTPASMIVTATDAATVEEDAAILSAQELPSQADDLDGDGKADEIAFQVDLDPHQTRILTVAYGEAATLARLRADYPARTAARFATRYEGMGWESETYAWRLYFDARNAIDLYGKRRPGLLLDLFAAPEYDYHAESPFGRDVYKNGDAIGIGSVAAWDGRALVKVADVDKREWRVAASGPVRSVAELRYHGWSVAGRRLELVSRITQWAGERGFTHRVEVSGGEVPVLVTGLPVKPGLEPIRDRQGGVSILATWGAQVLEPGRTATAALPDQKLGLAILGTGPERSTTAPSDDDLNHLQPVSLSNGAGQWYVYAAWDQEGSERMTGRGREGALSSMVLPYAAIASREAFLAEVHAQARALASPARVSLLSKKAGPQSAPPMTLAPVRSKTFKEAIDLLGQEAARTAATWLPALERPNNEVTREEGTGFFIEADNVTGEWKARNGYFWTAAFWVGSLWRQYELTGDERFRHWAEAWNSRLLGKEALENHDTGFLNYYSSVFGYQLTKDPKYREGGLRAAERLKKLFNPTVELIAAWEEKGNDTIIDTMMNLDIFWWATRLTGDESYRELGRRHAKKSLEWLFRPDGSTYQSVHYNPGDNTQVFRSSKVEMSFPNQAKPGEWVFKHTHQGWSADTAWSRGSAWAVYGFARAYQETKDPQFLAASRRTAAFMLDRLPQDGVPWYDMHDEGVMFRNRDTSAAAILANGLLLLSEAVEDKAAAQEYRAQGRRIVQSMVDRYLTPVFAGDKTPPGLLRHGSSMRPVDGPLVYGQYYLLEALIRLEAPRAKKPRS
jgi:unsaturated chondroitin disaccharide hydrolase